MIKRIIDISENSYVHLQHNQLLIEQKNNTVGRIPIEDLGIVILQHPAITLTQAVVIACQTNNVALVFCDNKHLPYSVILPLCDGHTLHTKILQQQILVKPTALKRLWQQIIREKIAQQALTLKLLGKNSVALDRLRLQVKSGDSGNSEAQASQKYWRLLFGDEFRRCHKEQELNILLNYGYAIVRALIARAIVGSGLHPAIGIHHRNQYNGLCLADDLMEPFRPWVDYLVYQIAHQYQDLTINTDLKGTLIGLLSEQVYWEDNILPFMVSCHHFMANLKRAYNDRSIQLKYPQLCSRVTA